MSLREYMRKWSILKVERQRNCSFQLEKDGFGRHNVVKGLKNLTPTENKDGKRSKVKCQKSTRQVVLNR